MSRLNSPQSRHTPTPAFSPPPADFHRVRFATPQYITHSLASPVHGDVSDVGNLTPNELGDDEETGDGWNGQSNKVVLAITGTKGKVGCCAYDGPTGKLAFLEDQQDSSTTQGGWELVRLVIEQVRPDVVLTSASAEQSFLSTIETALAALPSSSSSSVSGASTEGTSTQLEYRPSREFYAGQGRNALAQLHVADGGGALLQSASYSSDDGESVDSRSLRNAYDFGRRKKRRVESQPLGDRGRRTAELRLESFLGSLSASPLALGSAGALLAYIARSSGDADEEESAISVSSIELLKLDAFVYINMDALTSLQIFADESHASTHSNQTKEGLSLFGVVNLAHTPVGRLLMRQWFLRPSLDLDVIQARHNAVECFLRSENQHIADAIQSNFHGIKNAPKRIRNLSNGKGGIPDWQTVWQFLYGALVIRDAVLSLVHRRGVEVIDKFLSSFDADHFRSLGVMINDVIDWDESRLQKGHVAVKSGVDSELDELRRRYHGLSSLLTKAAEEVCLEVPPGFAESVSLVYYPQLGYLISVPFKESMLDQEQCQAVGWEFQFHTEWAYFKSDKCRDLDYHLGDIHSFIGDKELEILQTLLDHVIEQEPAILATSDCLAELDCLLAFAEAARLNKWNRPTMTVKPVCKILQGRHPLVELTCDSFVPNDTSLVGGRGIELDQEPIKAQMQPPDLLDPNQSMLVITGANFSGKSVLLKQVAMLTFMAHIGCFVPAEKCLIGFTDRILTRVSTKESITRGASAFTIDLQQISFALRNATRHSLVIIDEFGKGTESDDGAGLFTAVLEDLNSRGAETPRVVVATHFHSIFATQLLSPSLPIGLAHMEILVHDNSEPASKLAQRPAVKSNASTSSSTDRTSSNQSSKSSSSSSAFSNLTYLYRLQPGLTLTSHALACAALFSIPTHVLSRAQAVSHAVATFDLESLVRAPLSDWERKELKASEGVGRRFLEWDLGELEWLDESVERERVVEKLGQVLGPLAAGDEGGQVESQND